MQSFQTAGTSVHQQAQQKAADEGGPAGAAGEEGEDVVEGEVVDEGGAA
jgi:hypothetical protein